MARINLKNIMAGVVEGEAGDHIPIGHFYAKNKCN